METYEKLVLDLILFESKDVITNETNIETPDLP